MSKDFDFDFDPQKAADWVNEHWKDGTNCPICKDNNWTVGSDIVLAKADILKAYPLVLIVCNQCGYTLHFNALTMGLVEPDGK